MPSSSAAEQCRFMKKELLDKVDILSRALPPNTLDKLIDDLGGPENVAEVKKIRQSDIRFILSSFQQLKSIYITLLLGILL